jgi:hypothetical protein
MERILFAAIACAFFVTGCAPSFAGTYSGPVTFTFACTDAQGNPQPARSSNSNQTLTITENGSTARFTDCGGTVVTADVSGNVAQVNPYSCPASTDNGITTSLSVTGGTLTLNGQALGLDLVGTSTSSGNGLTIQCTFSLRGTLADSR